MRRSELLGVRRDRLDLEAATLDIDNTLISVGGRAEESDRKSEAGVRSVALDAFTVAAPAYASRDARRGTASAPRLVRDGGWLYAWPDGRRPHPDSVTDRFNRLVDAAGSAGFGCMTSGTPTQRWG
jgi:hypothetical protein